ncbi:MAG: hypothetical protein WBD10_10040, partial [Acidobacteriaceae bacterium]
REVCDPGNWTSRHRLDRPLRNLATQTPCAGKWNAAYTSSLNQCEFCMKAHAAVSAKLPGDERLVWSVVRDFESSPLDEKPREPSRFQVSQR